MRYVIIAILIYAVFLVLRAVLRNYLNNRESSAKSEQGKTKRRYNLDKVQDAEYTEVKKNGAPK